MKIVHCPNCDMRVLAKTDKTCPNCRMDLSQIKPDKQIKQDTDVNQTEFTKEWLPIWCEQCDLQGYVFADNFEKSYYVVCKGCGSEYSQVWCPECGMGGDFIDNLKEHPSSWTCSDCKNEYSLPARFYTRPVSLYLEDMIPKKQLNQIKHSLRSTATLSSREYGAIALIIGSLFMPPLLVPMIYKILGMKVDVEVTAICFILWILIWTCLVSGFNRPIRNFMQKWLHKDDP